MGLLDSLLGKIKGKKETQEKDEKDEQSTPSPTSARYRVKKETLSSGSSLIVEEIKLRPEKSPHSSPPPQPQKRPPSKPKDEKAYFMEVVDELRREAGLPPVSASLQAPPSPAPSPQPPTPAKTPPPPPPSQPLAPVGTQPSAPLPAPPKPVALPSPPPPPKPATAPPTPPQPSPPPSPHPAPTTPSSPTVPPQPPKTSAPAPPPEPATPPRGKEDTSSLLKNPRELAKVIKVATNRLEDTLSKLYEEHLRSRGIKSYKEIALAKRKVRDLIHEKADYISDRFVEALKSGRDPREETFILPLAQELLANLTGPEKPTKVEKKEEDDDLLSLLEGSAPTEGSSGEEVSEEDLLKLLGGE